MHEPDQRADLKICAECGLHADTSIKSLKLPLRARIVGPGVSLLLLLLFLAVAFWPSVLATPISSGGGSVSHFVQPIISIADLRELAASSDGGRSRLVEPVHDQLIRMHRDQFPSSADSIALLLERSGGDWTRTWSFGKPLAWAWRYEQGEIRSDRVPRVESSGSSRGWRVVTSSHVGGNPGELLISLGSVATACVIVLATGWGFATAAAMIRRRRRRTANWIDASIVTAAVLVAWSFMEGARVQEWLIRSSGQAASLAPVLATTSIDDLRNPAQTDAALARSILHAAVSLSDERHLVMQLTRRYVLVNSSYKMHSEDLFLLYAERSSYASVDDALTPIVIPQGGWQWTVADDFLAVRPPTSGHDTVATSFSINLGNFAIGLLIAMVAGILAGAGARRLATMPARSRQRASQCIGCGYPRPATG